jgi:predicted dehydrogenase
VPRVAVVGCGRWGVNVVRDLVRLGCATVAVDVSPVAVRAAEAAGASASFAELDHALDDGVDGVVVATPTSTHAEVATRALGAGLPVFVEKPMTDDVAAARSLAELGGARLFVMHKWRYHPGIEALAALAAGGRLGEVRGVISDRHGPARPTADSDVVWLLAPHEVTIARAVLGSFPDAVEAVADVAGREVQGIESIARWRTGQWHRSSTSARPLGTGRRVAVVGALGCAVLDGPYEDHVRVHAVDEVGDGPERVPISTEYPLARELRAFVDHLQGGPPPPTSGAEGLEAVEAVAAMRRSAGLVESGPHR